MPKIIQTSNINKQELHLSDTELEGKLTNAVVFKNIAEAEAAIYELNVTGIFDKELLINIKFCSKKNYNSEILHGDSLALVAVKNNDIGMLKMLLSNGFAPHVPSFASSVTPLWYAAYKGYTDLAKVILEYPLEINKIYYKTTPLKAALQYDNLGIVKLLLEKSNANHIDPLDIKSIIELPHDKFISIVNEISLDKKKSIFNKISEVVKNDTPYYEINIYGVDSKSSEVNKAVDQHINCIKNRLYITDYLVENGNDTISIIGSSDLDLV